LFFDQSLLADLADRAQTHSRSSTWWEMTNQRLGAELDIVFQGDQVELVLGEVGKLKIRNANFGSIEAKHLFGLDELIIFAWYNLNKNRYRKTLDLGANIGIHSLVMSKLGFEVTAYEPDPIHIEIFKSQLQDNSVKNISLRTRAIAHNSGKMNFTRVIGNTTGSHLTGAKQNPYGDLEYFEVDVDAFRDTVNEGYDFIKMDVEGFEAKLLGSLDPRQLENTEIMLEIGTYENAMQVWKNIERLGLIAYSQKINWNQVTSLSGVPFSYKEGSLFLTSTVGMAWK
jgi:FkbM family methyltransferase